MFKETCAIFEQMEISEQVYERQKPSKNIPRVDFNHDGHGRKRKGGEASLPTNPNKGRTDKHKKKMQSPRARR